MLNFEPVSKDLMRQMNRSLVLNTVRLAGPISRAQISRESGLCAATVSGLVADLIQEDLVFEQEEGDSSGGRRPVLLSLNPSGGFAIGIKLMEDHLIAALTNLEAKVIDSINVPFNGMDPKAVIAMIVEGVSLLLQNNKISQSKLLGVGVGLAGVVDQDSGLLRLSPIFGWQGLPFGRMIQERLEVPVFIDNDVNTVTLTERWFGAAKDFDHFLTVTIGRSVGMGIVTNGRLYRGRGGAGEFGHTVVDPEGDQCFCGKRGCLETFVANPFLVKKAQRIKRISAKVQTVDDLRALAEFGDPEAKAIYKTAGEMLGRGIANLVNIFDPQMIILTGEGFKARDLFSERMFASIRVNTLPGLGHDLLVHIDELDDLAWARGAAGLVLRVVFESPIFIQNLTLKHI